MTTEPKDSGDRLASHMKKVAGYFDTNATSWSQLYQEVRHINDVVLGHRKDLALEFLERSLSPGARVLDAGCGAGILSLELATRGYSICGVDVSPRMIELCHQHFSRAEIAPDRFEFHNASVGDSPLVSESFDAVAAMGYLQYQPDEVQALHELGRLLKPNGVLVISGPVAANLSNGFGLGRILERLKDRLRGTRAFEIARAIRRGAGELPVATGSTIAEISRHGYGVRRFRELLNAADFDLVEWRGHGFIGFPGHQRAGLGVEIAVHRGISALSRALPLSRFGNDMVVLATRRALGPS